MHAPVGYWVVAGVKASWLPDMTFWALEPVVSKGM